jgi:hypothetical protein
MVWMVWDKCLVTAGLVMMWLNVGVKVGRV